MRRPSLGVCVLTLAALLLWPRSARADWPSEGKLASTAVLFLLPHDLGVFMTPGSAFGAIGWSIQVPFNAYTSPVQRIVPEFTWVPTSDEHPSRGRLGYRIGGHFPFGGVGITYDRSGMTWSPELGVRFAHDHRRDDGANRAFHFIVRADLAPIPSELEGVTFLLGWAMF